MRGIVADETQFVSPCKELLINVTALPESHKSFF